MEALRQKVRAIPDFPNPGIVFRDITPLLADATALADAVDVMAAPFQSSGIRAVAGIEARGFIFAALVAERLGAGFVPLRKPGKLPYEVHRVSYELEYGADALEVHTDAVTAGDQVLVVDDIIATGGTAAAAGRLLGNLGAELVGYSFLIELEALEGRDSLGNVPVHSGLIY